MSDSASAPAAVAVSVPSDVPGFAEFDCDPATLRARVAQLAKEVEDVDQLIARGAYEDAWSSRYMRLPCSPQNNLSSWASLCRFALDLPQSISEFEKRFCEVFLGESRMPTLAAVLRAMYPDERSNLFIEQVLPRITELALRTPLLFPKAVENLAIGQQRDLILSQEQSACLLANMFFCLMPRDEAETATYQTINFATWIAGTPSTEQMSKMACLLHYFERVGRQMPSNRLRFRRHAQPSAPDYGASARPLLPVDVRVHGTIEDAHGHLQVDFANEYIGGGVLGYGCVQEEILFAVRPDCLVSLIFCEVMRPAEAILIQGAQQFAAYRGYASTFEFTGPYPYWAPPYVGAAAAAAGGSRMCGIGGGVGGDRDEDGVGRVFLVAIDAGMYFRGPLQFTAGEVHRELLKSYAGFTCTPLPLPLATGNWGCGAFGGDKPLKSIIQWVTASLSGRPMRYYTFRDAKLGQLLEDVTRRALEKQLTVGDLYKLIMQYCAEAVHDQQSLLLWLRQRL